MLHAADTVRILTVKEMCMIMKNIRCKAAAVCSLLVLSLLLSGCVSKGPGDVLSMADEAFESGRYLLALRKYSVVMESLTPAQEMNMGWMYYTGSGTLQNMKKALEWYERAANTGNPEAMFALGEIYENGPSSIADENKAAVLYYKAAGAGNADAMFSLAKCYENGTGVDNNLKEAAYWYGKAAEKGNNDAALCLARLNEADVSAGEKSE